MPGPSGLTFAHLQPLSRLLKMHTLVTGGWRPDKYYVAASEQEGLTDEACVPAADVLSSWFPALQDMTYKSGGWHSRMPGHTCAGTRLHCHTAHQHSKQCITWCVAALCLAAVLDTSNLTTALTCHVCGL